MTEIKSAEEYFSLLSEDILKKTSRSLYITISLMPNSTKHFLSLAYLISRAFDILTDNETIPPELRLKAIDTLNESFKNYNNNGMSEISNSVLPYYSNENDKELLNKIPVLIDWLANITEEKKIDIRLIIAHLYIASTYHVNTFTAADKIHFVSTENDLIKYAYNKFGAGIKIITLALFRMINNFSVADRDQLADLGEKCGTATQLLKILSSLPTDLNNGRCYLPLEQLKAAGINPEDILNYPEKLNPILNHWHTKILEGLDAGLEYILSVNSIRIRLASTIALIISIKTLILLKNSRYIKTKDRVKLSSDEIRRIVFIASLSALSNPFTKQYFSRLIKSAAEPIK